MKRIVVCFFVLCFISISSAFSDYDMIPNPIDEKMLNLSATTNDSTFTLTGIRFDLDDENTPVIIIREKQKNISERSIAATSGIWIFAHDPDKDGPALTVAAHYNKEYIGVKLKKQNGKTRAVPVTKYELAPGEEYEREYVYNIENFTDPVFMYYVTADNTNQKKEIVTVIPETGSIK